MIDNDDESSTPIWDNTALSQMFHGNEEYVREALRIFLVNVSCRMESLKRFVSVEDTENIRLEAHSIKGSAAAVGGNAMRSVAFEIEQAARASDMEGIKDLMSQLLECFANLKAVISEKFPDIRNPEA